MTTMTTSGKARPNMHAHRHSITRVRRHWDICAPRQGANATLSLGASIRCYAPAVLHTFLTSCMCCSGRSDFGVPARPPAASTLETPDGVDDDDDFAEVRFHKCSAFDLEHACKMHAGECRRCGKLQHRILASTPPVLAPCHAPIAHHRSLTLCVSRSLRCRPRFRRHLTPLRPTPKHKMSGVIQGGMWSPEQPPSRVG
jgi:hypothetical protein